MTTHCLNCSYSVTPGYHCYTEADRAWSSFDHLEHKPNIWTCAEPFFRGLFTYTQTLQNMPIIKHLVQPEQPKQPWASLLHCLSTWPYGFPEMLNNTPVPFAFNSSPGVSYLWICLSSLATREYKWAGKSDHLTSRCTCQEGNPTLCLSDINNPSRFPNRASEACCPRNETQPAGISWALQNVLLQCPLRLLQCVSPRQQKPKGILAWLEKVISFYVMTLQSNCAQNNCFYCLNTFLVLEHPGGFNCACNFADINEGD